MAKVFYYTLLVAYQEGDQAVTEILEFESTVDIRQAPMGVGIELFSRAIEEADIPYSSLIGSITPVLTPYNSAENRAIAKANLKELFTKALTVN